VLVAVGVAALALVAGHACFISVGHRGRARPTLRAAGGAEAGTKAADRESTKSSPYDWQRVGAGDTSAAGSKSSEAFELPDLPDLPGADDEEDDDAGVRSLGAKVSAVELPDLPGEEDLLPPEPNPNFEGGLGLWQWTGLWVLGVAVIVGLGAGGTMLISRAEIDPEFAASALGITRNVCTLFQILFLGRVLLSQFPKIKTSEMPWAPVHYATEWALGPTRSVFKPEAGVDISPIIWLLLFMLGSELLTGPSGILSIVKDRAPLPPGLGR